MWWYFDELELRKSFSGNDLKAGGVSIKILRRYALVAWTRCFGKCNFRWLSFRVLASKLPNTDENKLLVRALHHRLLSIFIPISRSPNTIFYRYHVSRFLTFSMRRRRREKKVYSFLCPLPFSPTVPVLAAALSRSSFVRFTFCRVDGRLLYCARCMSHILSKQHRQQQTYRSCKITVIFRIHARRKNIM